MASTRKTGLRRSPITLSVHYSTSSKPISKVYSHPQVRFAHQRLRIVEPLQGSIGKARPRRGDGIPAWESLPTPWGRNPSPRKARPRRGEGIPAWESFATPWGRNRGLRKLRHAVGKKSQPSESLPTPWGRNPSLHFPRFLSMSRFSVSTEAVVVKPSWGVFMQ